MPRRLLASLLAIALVLGAVPPASAATVTFKNGDRLTGRILSVFDGRIILATEHAGEVAADWSEVAALSSDEVVVLYLIDGDRVEGQLIDLTSGWLGVRAPEGVRTIALPLVASINTRPQHSRSERRRQEQAAEPGAVEGGLELGSLHAWGNTESLGTSARLWLGRDTRVGRFDASLSALLAEGADAERGLEEVLAVRWQRPVTRAWYAFGLSEVEHDEHERLDLRAVLAPGMGRSLASGERWDLRGELGIAVSHTAPQGEEPAESELEAHAGLCAAVDLPRRSTLTTELRLFGGGEVRSLARLAVDVPLDEHFRLSAALIDRTDSDPVPGVERNDFQVRLGVAVAF